MKRSKILHEIISHHNDQAAIPFFSRASQIEPNEVKWRLMVASCYRRMGAYPAALKLYEEIHRSHPNDIECVRYLITICKEMKQKYDHYAAHLRKLERLQEAQNGQGRPMGTVSAIDESPHDEGARMGFGGSRGHFDDEAPEAPPDPPRPPMVTWMMKNHVGYIMFYIYIYLRYLYIYNYIYHVCTILYEG